MTRLNTNEAAALQELIEREGEPALCACGRHYKGADCPKEKTNDHES